MTGEGQSKSLDGLAEYMRKFQARSKIVFLITSQGSLFVQDRDPSMKYRRQLFVSLPWKVPASFWDAAPMWH